MSFKEGHNCHMKKYNFLNINPTDTIMFKFYIFLIYIYCQTVSKQCFLVGEKLCQSYAYFKILVLNLNIKITKTKQNKALSHETPRTGMWTHFVHITVCAKPKFWLLFYFFWMSRKNWKKWLRSGKKEEKWVKKKTKTKTKL